MNDPTVTIDGDGGLLVVEVRHGPIPNLTISLLDVVSSLSAEQRRTLVDVLSLNDELLGGALRRLAGEGDTGQWTGDDDRTREEWLAKIGAIHAEDVKRAEESTKKAWKETRDALERLRVGVDQVLGHLRAGETFLPGCCWQAISNLDSFAPPRVPIVVPPHQPPATAPEDRDLGPAIAHALNAHFDTQKDKS